MHAGWLAAIVFYPMAGALLSYLIGRKSKEARNYFADFIVISEFLVVVAAAVNLQDVEMKLQDICGMGLHFKMDGFRGVYTVIAAFMWMMTIIFSREYFGHYRNRNRYYLFQLVTLGATIGVFASADLFTTFIFFEIMSFTSYVWVAQDERKEALRAAETYLAVAVIGGMVLLMGLFLLYTELGTLEISRLLEAARNYPDAQKLYIAGGCILVGFGAKAGAFPLHIWLPKAHPVAPAPASALLSGILTKAGVFGILVISCNLFYGDGKWGMLILILGVITMFGGAVLAVFSVDLKRTLACSSMSQIGFILVGVGMMCILGEHGAIAGYGTLLHMVNHSLIKLVLFMVAGVVFMNIHQLDLNEIRGFGRQKPFLNVTFLMGALGIGGIPLWNGYVSKTLLHESIVEYYAEHAAAAPMFTAIEWIFLISGGFTVAYMLKLYIALFVEKNQDAKKQEKFDSLKGHYMNHQSRFAIGGSAVILPVLGMTPALTMMRIGEEGKGFLQLRGEFHMPQFFGWDCLKGGLVSILIGGLLYLFGIRKLLMKKTAQGQVYLDAWPKWLDMENLIYRPLLQRFLPFVGTLVCRMGDTLVDGVIVLLRKTIYKDRKNPYRTGAMPKMDVFIGKAIDYYYQGLRPKAGSRIAYLRKLRQMRMEQRESHEMIRYRLSYGMQLVGIGMLIVLAYLIF